MEEKGEYSHVKIAKLPLGHSDGDPLGQFTALLEGM
jgi:hypothetical protein